MYPYPNSILAIEIINDSVMFWLWGCAQLCPSGTIIIELNYLLRIII
jgi:hypothetical protein